MPFNPDPDISTLCPCPCCREDNIDLREPKYDLLCVRAYFRNADGEVTELETDAFRFGFVQCAWYVGLPSAWTCVINENYDPECPFPAPVVGSATLEAVELYCGDSCLPCDILNNWFIEGSSASQCGGENMDWSGVRAVSGSCDPFIFSFAIPAEWCEINREVVPEGCDCECDICEIYFDVYLPPCPDE